MPTALIGPAIGAAGSIVGNLIGGNAASKAAKQAAQTGQAVAGQLNKSTQDAINAGYYSMGQASNALQTGLGGAEGAYNNALAGQQAAIQGAAGQARTDLTQGKNDAQYAIRQGLSDATNRLDTSTQQANTALGQAYADQKGFLNPYLKGGAQGMDQLSAFMGPTGPGQKQFDASMMEEQDPGYAFRKSEGEKALAHSAAAGGGIMGAAATKDLLRYNQDYASSEYQNAWNRYQQGKQQQFNMLGTLAGFGQNAANTAVGAAGQYGQGQAGNIMGAGSQIANANLGAQGQIANASLGVGGQLANTDVGAGGALANAQGNWGQQVGAANLGTGNALANMQMQGGQYIGQTGLQGAQLAGNALMGAANAGAAGTAMKGNMWGQGLASGLGQIGAGITNYYNNRNDGQSTADVRASLPWNSPQIPAVMGQFPIPAGGYYYSG